MAPNDIWSIIGTPLLGVEIRSLFPAWIYPRGLEYHTISVTCDRCALHPPTIPSSTAHGRLRTASDSRLPAKLSAAVPPTLLVQLRSHCPDPPPAIAPAMSAGCATHCHLSFPLPPVNNRSECRSYFPSVTSSTSRRLTHPPISSPDTSSSPLPCPLSFAACRLFHPSHVSSCLKSHSHRSSSTADFLVMRLLPRIMTVSTPRSSPLRDLSPSEYNAYSIVATDSFSNTDSTAFLTTTESIFSTAPTQSVQISTETTSKSPVL